jgi:nitrite reductase (NO-forming)
MVKAIGFSVTILTLIITVSSFKQAYNLPESIERGKDLYITYCQSCHMADGNGVAGAFPPLAKADYMKNPAKVLINVILKGQSGEVAVNSVNYNSPMPAQNYLTDEQIADILNYAKNRWGNKSTIAIKPDQVKQARQ